MKNTFASLIIALTCILAACGSSNFEWFPDPLDETKPTVSAIIAGQSVFTNNTSNTTNTVTATVSSLPASLVFSSNEPAKVYYTLNGADPTTASTFIDIPVAGGQIAAADIAANNTTLKFYGIDKSDQKNKSAIQSILVKSSDTTAAAITTLIGTAAMVNNGTTSIDTLPVQVVFKANEPAIIYFTSDGIEPTVNSDFVVITSAQASVDGPLIATAGTTLKYFSFDRSANSSTTQTTTIAIKPSSDTTAPAVAAKVSGQTLFNNSSVTAATKPVTVNFIASEPVTVYYTTNNSEPTTSSASVLLGSTLQADGPAISITNTILWFFGVDLANNSSTKIKGTVILP